MSWPRCGGHPRHLNLTQRLLDGFEQDLGMSVSKRQHRSQPDRQIPTRPHLDPVLAYRPRKQVPRLGIVEIPGDECSHPFAAEVLDDVLVLVEHVVQA